MTCQKQQILCFKFQEEIKMNLEEKISKIKQSCKVGETVTNIFFILALVGSIIAFIAGGYIFSMGKEFDVQMKQAEEEGYVSKGM